MAKKTYQNDPKSLDEVHHFACYVDSLYNYKSIYQNIDTSIYELNNIWITAKEKNIIDNNPKSPTYLEIIKPQELVNLMNLPLKYIPGHFSPNAKIPSNVYVICNFYNARTKFIHFGAYDPINKKVLFDPIYPKSITFTEGVLNSFRFYEILSGETNDIMYY